MKTSETYQTPSVEVVEAEVEIGFAGTPGGTTDNPGGSIEDMPIE